MTKLDDLLRETRPASTDALAAVRAAALQELRGGRVIAPWPRQLALFLALVYGLVGLVTVGLLATGQTSLATARAHAPALALLVMTVGVAAIGGLRPRSTAALGFAALGFVGLAWLRPDTGYASASPEWLCTVSHLAAGAVPLAAALAVLKGWAPNWKRALLIGLAAGGAGAMMGELGCERGPLHVAVYHLTAWTLVAAAVTVGARFIAPRSFAE